MLYFLKTGKMKLPSLIYGIVLIVILMDCVFFNLIQVPAALSTFWNEYNKLLPGIFCFLLFVVFTVVAQSKEETQSPFVYMYVTLSAVSIVIVISLSGIKYPDIGLLSFLIETSHYWYLFLIVPLLYYFRKEDRGYEKIMRMLNIVVLLTYMVALVQSIAFDRSGLNFLTKELTIQDGSVRMGIGCFGNVMILYNIDRFYNATEKRTSALLSAILGVLVMLLIQRTRGFTIVSILCIGAVVLMNNRTIRKTFMNVLLIAGVAIYLVYSGILPALLESLNPETGVNIGIRLEAIGYFWKEFSQNMLYGHGLAIGPRYYSISRGSMGLFFYSDVGVIGSLAQYGLFYVILYIWPMVHMGRIAVKWLREKNTRQKYAFLIGIYMFLLLTSASLVVTDMFRMLLFPFCIAIFEYQNTDYLKQHEG